jgi:GNAT superfamily N-acetyltransferase
MNPAATQQAREEMVIQMAHLYRLDRFADAVRFHLYRHTYFAPSENEVGAAFERLIARRSADPHALHSQLEELSALQSLLTDPVDRAVFSRMVFPHAHKAQKLELMALGTDTRARVIVRSEIADDSGSRYVVREPLTAVELGNLYRLILETDYPMHIGDRDRQLVIADGEERIVGGLCYRWQEGGVASVDGIVVAPALTNQGLGGGLLEDFCVRMGAEGAGLVRTNFFLGGLFSKHGFQVNQRWGGLVRLLAEDADTGRIAE